MAVIQVDPVSNWDKVLPGLLRVQEKTPAYLLDWTPRSILEELLKYNAFLFMGENDPHAGFFILVPKAHPITQERELIVWVAYSPLADAQIQYADDLKAIAKTVGAKRLLFRSSRRGFQHSQWEPVAVTYRMEIDGE